MAFSFESEEFMQAIHRLKRISGDNMNASDLELKKWAQLIRSIQFIFTEDSLKLLQKNAIETMKWDLFNLDAVSQDDPIEFLRVSAINLCIYMKEAYFRLGGGEDSKVQQIYEEVYDLKKEFYLKYRTYFNYLDELPYRICREIYTDSRLNEIRIFLEEKNFGDYKDLIRESEKASDLIYDWESTFEVKVDEVERLEKKLESYKTTYDFVLLNKGFQQLYEQKQTALTNPQTSHKRLYNFIIAIPLSELIFFAIVIALEIKIDPIIIWYMVIPSISLIILLLYFYKVNLQETRSIKSQMMQLELRMALCQFIHNYAEDSEKLHAKNKAGFEKFENIIFSPLVSSDDKIPTTFDGMEQLAKLVSEFRK